jgi:hypothetical protein
MVSWAYDSYANDNVQDVIDETEKNQSAVSDMIIDVFDQVLPDYPSLCELEFLVGIIIWCIRSGYSVSKSYLRTTNDIITFILENSDFKYWKDPQLRRNKLKFEKNLLIKGLLDKNIQETILKMKGLKIVSKDIQETILKMKGLKIVSKDL